MSSPVDAHLEVKPKWQVKNPERSEARRVKFRVVTCMPSLVAIGCEP